MTKCTYGENARMTWPKAIRIEGNGQYASVSFCAHDKATGQSE